MACCDDKEKQGIVGSVYLNVGNGGILISVKDDCKGPQIEIESSQFGNNLISQKILVSVNELEALARLFNHATYYDYSEKYCHAATVVNSYPASLSEGLRPDRGNGCCGGSCHKE